MRLIIKTLLLFLAAYFMPSIHVDKWWDALWAVLIVSLADFAIGLMLGLVGFVLPIVATVVGLFVGVISIYVADRLLAGFAVQDVWGYLVLLLILGGTRLVRPQRRWTDERGN